MKNIYDFETSVVSCQECSAPIEIALTGGVVSCAYCGTENKVTPLNRNIFVFPSHLSVSEEERLEVLRKQTGDINETPSELPKDLRNTTNDGWISNALKLWKKWYSALDKSITPKIEEAFAYLTELIGGYYDKKNEPLRMRGIFERALEVIKVPRYRQSTLGRMSRNAAYAGDIQGAKKWLAMCDPKPTELQSDSIYRASHAVISIMEHNWNEVVTFLGEKDEIPFSDSLSSLLAVMQAGALEELNKMDAAAEALKRELVTGIEERKGVRYIIGMFKDNGVILCTQSLPMAKHLRNKLIGEEEKANRIKWGKIPLFIGMGVAVIAAVIILVTLVVEGTIGQGFAFFFIFFGAFVTIPTIVGITLFSIGFKLRKFYNHCVEVRGKIDTVIESSWSSNDGGYYIIYVKFSLPDKSDYTSKMTVTSSEKYQYGLNEGTFATINVDPENPKHIRLAT